MENKINIARFKEGSRTAEIKGIWQWDYGQILRIQGLNLPTAVEIHFSLDEHGGEAARRIGVTKDGATDVPIPDSMVDNESAYGDSYYFFAYIYLTDETSGNTEYKIRAKVSTRSKPEGYVSGDSTFAEILKTVNEIAEDKVTRPETAKVGQVLSVSEVDEDGRPTGFEATDPIEETDPTVPEWAKQPEKPSYTAEEVGALPAGTKIPSKTSDLQNDSKFTTLALDETLTDNTKAAPAGMVGELKSDLADLPQLETWDLAHRKDVVIYEKKYLSNTGATIEEQLTSHDAFFTLLIPVEPNTTYYGYDEYSNSEYEGRFAGNLHLLGIDKNITKTVDNPVLSVTTESDTAYVIFHNRYIDATTQNKGIYWFTDKEESDRIDTYNLHGNKIDVKDIINLIIPEIDKTLSIGGKVADAKAVGDAMRSVGGAEIQPRNFPLLPYKVVKTNDGYMLKDNLYDIKNVSSFKQIYVDSVNGSDSNDGTSRNTAYKTLKKALTDSIGKDSCINIIGDSVFYADDLYGEYPNIKSLAIIGENKPKLIHGDLPNWSIYNEESNTYSANLTYIGKCCVDMANIGVDGLYEGMKSVSDINSVMETENSYYIDGTTVYVHPISGHDASKTIVLKSGYGVRWNHQTSTSDHFLYLKNLNIIGGYYDVARSASYQVIGVNIEFFAEDCTLQHNPYGDGFPHNGYDVSYNINCTVGFSEADCFNHHHSGCTTEQIQNSIIVDMNCKAREAGYYRNPKQGNDNLFTCHDGENVLRLNCRGMTAPGPSFADVNGCRSVLVDCESYNNSYSELNIDGAWQFNNVSAIRDGFVTLVGCRIYDSRNIIKLLSDCDIEMMDTPVFDNMNVTGKLSICNSI